MALLANLSSLYALFEVTGAAGNELLRPVPLRRLDRYSDDLLTILKYLGKTGYALHRDSAVHRPGHGGPRGLRCVTAA